MQGFLARSSSLSAVERIAAKRREERLRATDPTAMSAEAMDLRAALLRAAQESEIPNFKGSFLG